MGLYRAGADGSMCVGRVFREKSDRGGLSDSSFDGKLFYVPNPINHPMKMRLSTHIARLGDMSAYLPPRPTRGRSWLEDAQQRIAHGDLPGAAYAARRALAADASLDDARHILGHTELGPEWYVDTLAAFHRVLRPQRYLEIGTNTGTTFALADPSIRAIGVDPEPLGPAHIPDGHHIYPETSDGFFATHSRDEVCGGPVDFAFIDGMHLFEYALRDFINVERWSSPDTVVVLHDTYPFDHVSANRRTHHTAPNRYHEALRRFTNQNSIFWSGDVWRLVMILRVHRPDLEIRTIPVRPTGLTVVMHLDPHSRVLSDGYRSLVAAYRRVRLQTFDINKRDILGIDHRPVEEILSRAGISTHSGSA